MGEGETGGRIAAPIFRDFMREALRDTPADAVPHPGGRAPCARRLHDRPAADCATSTQTILEAFRPDTEPTRDVASSPFVFGGTDPIDPRVLSGLDRQRSSPNAAAATPQQQEQQAEDLGGLY